MYEFMCVADVGRFLSRMCPVIDLSELTLKTLWNAGRQLIVFYHCDAVCRQDSRLWPATFIPAPWHNTPRCRTLVPAVDRALSTRCAEKFHVTQGVLTPDVGFVVFHPFQELRGALAGEVLAPLLECLGRHKCGPTGVNVVTVDFVESTRLVPVLLDMNRTLASHKQCTDSDEGVSGVLASEGWRQYLLIPRILI